MIKFIGKLTMCSTLNRFKSKGENHVELFVVLASVMIMGFVWMSTDQVIAPVVQGNELDL